MKNKNIKILIAGEGGQGVQTISKIILETAHQKGLEISFVPNYGVEQRGGVSLGYIQFGKQEIYYPKFIKADLTVFLSKRSINRADQHISKNTINIYNQDFIKKELPGKSWGYKFDTLAQELGNHRAMNMIVLGSIAKHLEQFISLEDIKDTINKKLAYKYKQYPELKKLNIKALELGYNL